MANLGIENLSRAIELDSGAESGGIASESRVMSEMQSQGMKAPSPVSHDSSVTFSDVLRKSVDDVNTSQVQADRAIQELVSGRTKNLHETMLAVEKADASLKLMMQVRNKILDAYREVMRMQV